MSINKVMLLGNVGSDPEIRSLPNGKRVASFSLATEESWKDKQTGERRKSTEWHRISVFAPGLVTLIERYVRKGSKISVTGKLRTRAWNDRDGAKRYTTEVVLDPYAGELTLEGSRRTESDTTSSVERGYDARSQSSQTYDEGYYSDPLDNEVPF